MTDTVTATTALPENLFSLIKTERVRVKEVNESIMLTPIYEKADCTIGLRGMFAGDPNITVENFIERKRADKKLDL